MKLDAWCKAILMDGHGKLILANLKYDLLHRRPDPDLMAEFLQELEQECERDACGPDIKRMIGFITARRSSFYLVQAERSAPPDPDGCSRVELLDSFFQQNVGRDIQARLNLKTGVQRSSRDLEKLNRRGRGPGGRLLLSGKLGNSRDFAWTAPRHSVTAVRNATTGSLPSEQLASKARDRLGLSHYVRADHLVELRYPADSLDLRAPTVLEGASGKVFRCDPQANGWGMTVDLNTWDRGAPEAVSRSVDASRVSEVLDLGVVGTTINPDYAAILATTPPDMHWSPVDEVASLRALP